MTNLSDYDNVELTQIGHHTLTWERPMRTPAMPDVTARRAVEALLLRVRSYVVAFDSVRGSPQLSDTLERVIMLDVLCDGFDRGWRK